MAPPLELFRFATTRRPDRAVIGRLDDLLIRDGREPTPGSLRTQLFAPGEFEPKLARANAYALSADYLAPDSPLIAGLEPFIAYLRERLAPGVPLADMAVEIRERFPLLAKLLERLGPGQSEETIDAAMFSIWDSLYAQTIRGCDRYVSTNHLIDALRAYHVLALLIDAARRKQAEWAGGGFDEYDALIDLQAAAAGATAAADGAALPLAGAGAPLASFRVPLAVGAIKPPVVGDLLLVEQELRRYVLGELASTESIMRGERRERTVRGLSRTTETTSTETLQEEERTSSLTTDERFQLSSQAQRSAQESLGVTAGVNVTGKYGPVQVSASVNAAFNSSSSTSDSTSQEYAKSITEEASESVRNSIKTTSSVTVLTEAEDTSLRGWNNETGSEHVNGLYRWIDKVYDTTLRNYGRRLMLSLAVPEPSAFYHGLLQQQEDAALAALEEPVPPSRLSPSTLEVLDPGDTGFASYQDVSEANYARLAARYDVAVEPPPTEFLTGAKAIAYPEAMQAGDLPEHDHPNDLSLVLADSTLTVAAGYRVTSVGVLATEGGLGGLRNWVDALKLGEDQAKVEDANVILVQVAGKSFSLTAYKDPDDNTKKVIGTDFNTYKPISSPSSAFGSLVQPSLPITVTANFEGALSLTVAYQATRTDEALDAWKASTWAAIVKGYTIQKQAYEQSLTLATATAESRTAEQTSSLREDQYRAIELTELKRGCIELLTEDGAAGHPSIKVAPDGTPRIIFDAADATGLPAWRDPLANGSVTEFFELAFEWESTAYVFHPYYWAGRKRWQDLAQAAGSDPVFEQFLRAGSASVVVPVRPGYERPVVFFLETGLIWGGGYLSLFSSPDMLDVYADVERGRQFDPPLQVGDSWEVQLPTSMVMLQADDVLPEFPPDAVESARVVMAGPPEPVGAGNGQR